MDCLHMFICFSPCVCEEGRLCILIHSACLSYPKRIIALQEAAASAAIPAVCVCVMKGMRRWCMVYTRLQSTAAVVCVGVMPPLSCDNRCVCVCLCMYSTCVCVRARVRVCVCGSGPIYSLVLFGGRYGDIPVCFRI